MVSQVCLGFFGRGHPLGVVYPPGGAKIGEKGSFENVLGNLGKFVDKKAIKRGFEVVLVEISRKFQINTHFWEKNTSIHGQKFGDTSTQVSRTSPPQ